MTVRLFVDFDGTVTQEDVGNAFFRMFGGEQCDASVDSYRSGALSASECFTLEAAAMGEFRLADATSFLRSRPIDATFPSLLNFAGERGYEVTIVSDGLDFYITEILAANNLKVPFFANRAEVTPGSIPETCSLRVDFPYADEECTRCACCKRNLMLTQSADEDVIVLIGEGYSDTCPARFADIVFAHNISYLPYMDFSDVARRLEAMTADGRPLRRRSGAALRRRAAFREE